LWDRFESGIEYLDHAKENTLGNHTREARRNNPTGGMTMTTQTTQPAVTTEREELIEAINTLSDASIVKLASFIAFLRYEDEIPNAETIAAMMEAESGGGEETTIDEIMVALNAKD
jgi:hypothetical protein